jgi:uncharacterized damage-inducible protein DinB
MKNEIAYLTKNLQSAYSGNPWFGRNIKEILSEIDSTTALQKPNGQHSILELLYHMINWREFTISRLKPDIKKTSTYFNSHNWGKHDHTDALLWDKGLLLLESTQLRLLDLLKNLKEENLSEKVAERKYNFQYLLHGVIQHDIYHLGQIAYVKKLLK